MNRFLRRVIIYTILLANLCVGGAEAQSLDGLPIAEVRYEGLSALAVETLDFYLGLEVGAVMNAAELNSKVLELWETRLIDDISINSSKTEAGVVLVVSIQERRTLQSIEYVGLKKISRTDVTDRISKDRIDLREGDPLSRGEVDRLKAAIEALYAEKGFRLAEASYSIDEDSASTSRIVFSVDEGDKVRIGDVDFEGNTVFGDRRLRFAMKKTKEKSLWHRLLKKDVFKVAAFDEDLENVKEVYRKAGYKNILLGEPEIEIKSGKPTSAGSGGKNRKLHITIPLEEGNRWKLGDITINGNDTFSDELLLTRFKKPRGDWLRAEIIDEGVEAIQEIYSNTGHLYAQIRTEIEERDGDFADLIVNIDEGSQFRISRIEFEGNIKTRDKVIRREMGIQEGLVMNSGALRNSLLRIRQLEFFKVDEEDPVSFDFDNEEKEVDLTIKGEEGDRTELLFGGGFSELDGFFGQFSFRTRNFLGRGETLGVSVQSGRRQDVFDLSYSIPWFLDRPQSVGVQLFQRKLDFSLLSGQRLFQNTTGGTVTYGRNLGLFKSLSMSFSRFESEDQRTVLLPDSTFSDQVFSRQVSSIRLNYNFDKRDSRLQPTVGTRYNASVEYTGGLLGGTTNFVRGRAVFSHFVPITKKGLRTVAAINAEIGAIKPFAGDDLFFNDRFYLGGENTIRGHRFRSIWVRDREGNTVTDLFGTPLGGDKFLQFNGEFHFLLGGPFRVLFFGDAANVFSESQDYSFDGMRYTGGLEMQINVPVFGAPLRFIWSRNLDPRDDDRFEPFQFSVGTSF